MSGGYSHDVVVLDADGAGLSRLVPLRQEQAMSLIGASVDGKDAFILLGYSVDTERWGVLYRVDVDLQWHHLRDLPVESWGSWVPSERPLRSTYQK